MIMLMTEINNTVYECEVCGFKTDEKAFMSAHIEIAMCKKD